MRQALLRSAPAAGVALSLLGCLGDAELDTRRPPVDLETGYDDTGIPFDPRDEVGVGGDVDGGGGSDGGDGGGSDGGGTDGGADATPDAPVGECDEARPCTAPLVCEDGFCVPECELAADCEEGFVCVDLACVEQECTSNDGCDPRDEICDGGLCVEAPCNLIAFEFDPGGTTYTSVHVAGDFNATAEVWPPTIAAGGWPLTFDADAGVWFGRFEIDNGVYEYKLVLNEETFILDPNATSTVPDPFGGENGVLTVDCDGSGTSSCGDLDAFDWRDTVMYFVMVDRFYDGDGEADPVAGATDGDAFTGASGQYEGGDLAGVTARMDYLADLGVTALWLSAPFENRELAGAAIDPGADPRQYSGYHGYWPSPENIDYSDPDNPSPRPRVESRIGTEADLRALIAAAHGADSANGQGIRVLFDYVMNHVDLESGLYRANPSWFARRDGNFALCGPENLWDDPFWGTRCAFTSYLPPFDFDVPAARAWSVADAVWWAKEYGIDGYRLDAIKHVSLQWLRDLRSALSREFPDPLGGRFYLVGETFAYDDRDLLRRFVDPETLLDGQFDFPFKARLCEALFTPGGNLGDFATWMAGNDSFYGEGSLMTTWIGNHDIPRAIHFASGQIGNCREGSNTSNGWTSSYPQPGEASAYERLGLAFAVMMTNPGIPLIYYGDEIGLAGGGDPDNRRMMPRSDAGLSAAQLALRETVAELGRIRGENPVLARGRRVTRSADRDTWVYSMIGCGEGSPDITVAINRGDNARTLAIPAGTWEDLRASATVDGGSVSVGARDFAVLRRAVE
jgi:glycosidase